MLRLAAKVTQYSSLSLLLSNCAMFSRRRPNKPSEWWEQKQGLKTEKRIYVQTRKLDDMKEALREENGEEQKDSSKQEQKQKGFEDLLKQHKDKKIDVPHVKPMALLVVGSIFAVYLLGKFAKDYVQYLGTDTNEADFYNRINLGQFKKIKVVRRLEKDPKSRHSSKAEWVTRCVGEADTESYVILVHNLQETLNKLNKLNLPVEFEHRASSQVFEPGHEHHAVSIVIYAALFALMLRIRKQGLPGMGDIGNKLRGKSFKPTALTIKTQFKDVAGLQEAKHEITEFVEFLKNADKFTDMGAKIPRGALLTGPPGTGKTLLAKACAGEAGVPFFYISGSEFIEKFVGVGASRVRNLFEAATKKAPSIIFIDEIDAIGRKRGSGPRTNEERVGTLNQLLVNMDGFGTDSKVVVLAATNRKDMLDPALLRPGRFDRIIQISLPDLQGRFEILNVHLDKIRFNPNTTKETLARRLSSLTPGFSGADLSNICNEAAILAARGDKEFVEMVDFEKATERVLAGLEKRNNLTDQEKKIIAYHESGRAVASWLLEGGDPLIKLTIVPRSKKSLGYSQFLPDQVSLNTKQELLDKICCALAGKVSEELVLHQMTDSSTADLEKARKIAYAMVTRFGMSDVINNIGYPDSELIKKPYSSSLEEKIDDEVFRIISCETNRVKQLLTQNLDKLNALADAVLQKQTLNLQEIKNILGERPFAARSNFKAYLSLSKEDPPIVPKEPAN